MQNSDLKAFAQSIVAAVLGTPVSPQPVVALRSAPVVAPVVAGPVIAYTSPANTFQIIDAPIVGALMRPVVPFSMADFEALDSWLRGRVAEHLDWADDVAVQSPGLLVRGSGERVDELARRTYRQAAKVLGRSFAYELEPIVGLGWEIRHWHTGRPMVVAADETLSAPHDDPHGRDLVKLAVAHR